MTPAYTRDHTEIKHCPWCDKDKVLGEFYTRKRGNQSGQQTAYCIACNTNAVRYLQYRRYAAAGKLESLITSLKIRLALAERVQREKSDTERSALSLAVNVQHLDTEKL